jgi:hypothetical protein
MRDMKRMFVLLILLTGLLFSVTVATVNIVLPVLTGNHYRTVFATDGGVQTQGYGDEFDFPWPPGMK